MLTCATEPRLMRVMHANNFNSTTSFLFLSQNTCRFSEYDDFLEPLLLVCFYY